MFSPMNAQNRSWADKKTSSAQLEAQPRHISDVPGPELNSLLADLAAKGAWVLSMDVKGATYRLTIDWRPTRNSVDTKTVL